MSFLSRYFAFIELLSYVFCKDRKYVPRYLSFVALQSLNDAISVKFIGDATRMDSNLDFSPTVIKLFDTSYFGGVGANMPSYLTLNW